MTTGIPEQDIPRSAVRTVGAAEMAMISGLMIQWLMDEDAAPTAGEVLTGLRTLLGVDET
jgi:hypothetical protein